MKYIEDSGNHQIDKETMQNAVDMGRYFLRQAKKVFTESGLMTTQEERDAKYILSKIDSTGKMEMTLRDVYQMCKDKRGMERKEGMIPGLEYLIKQGFIRVEKVSIKSQNPLNSRKGGRPSEMIYVNPEYIKWKEQGQV